MMPLASHTRTVDRAEVEHFDASAGNAWGQDGPARWLHRYNLVRVPYIRQICCSAFGREAKELDPLRGLRILDVGCGAGILCEPLAQLGASVVGVDPAEKAVQVAAAHAYEMNFDVDYRCGTAEMLAEAGELFDVVLAMEVIEHVAESRAFVSICADLVSTNGVFIISTINRTFKSFFQVIVIGERVLRLLPSGTHQWTKFIRPDEVRGELKASGMRIIDTSGVTFNLMTRELQLSHKVGVNYMLARNSHARG